MLNYFVTTSLKSKEQGTIWKYRHIFVTFSEYMNFNLPTNWDYKLVLFISNCRSSLSLQHCSISGGRWDDQSHIFASDDSWPEVAFANSFFDRKRGRKWRGALATMAGCMRYRKWACCSTAKDHKTASDCRSNDWRVAEPLQKISVSWFLFKSFGWFLGKIGR